MRNTLHQTAVAHENIGIVINDREIRSVEVFSENLFSKCHTYCIGNTLTQRTGGGFNTRCISVFRMSRGF